MLKIRLTRRGKKNKAFYRIVVAEHTAPIKGRFLEALGYFNPHSKERNIKADRVKYWLEKGAQCSDTAHNLLVKEGIIKAPKRAIKIKKADKAEEADKAESTSTAGEAPETDKSSNEKKSQKEEETDTEKKKEKKPEKAKKESAEAEEKEEKKEEKA